MNSYHQRIHVGIGKPDLPVGRGEHELSINEMRAAIRRAGHRDSNLVRQCIYRAEVDGLDGEDTMTLIAYHALRMWDDRFMREMDRAMWSTAPLMAMTPERAKPA